MNNDSLQIILDNINVIKNRKRLSSFYELSQKSGISPTTISSWYSKARGKPVLPRLKTLDKLCDSLEIHTSDLFIPESQFEHEFSRANNSMEAFRINFKSICIEKGLITVQSQIYTIFSFNPDDFDSSKERYYSYFRKQNGRSIPIDQLDLIANKLNIHSHQLLI